MLLSHLRSIQEHFGYLPADEIDDLSARLKVPLHRLHEVISFFPHFRLAPPADVAVRVCRDQACHLRGADSDLQALEGVARELGGGERVTVEGVSCLGRCDRAPAVLLELRRKGMRDDVRVVTHKTIHECAQRVREVARAHLDGAPVPADTVDRHPLGWRIDPYKPDSLDESPGDGRIAGLRSSERYSAVREFATAIQQAKDAASTKAARQGLIENLKISDLRGMGGAGRPAFSKWGEVCEEAERSTASFVICNGDESEPSTFKDREILLRAPHLVIEGMVLGALLVGATRGYVYIRHEYFEQVHAVETEIERARELGVVGANVLGTGQSFELEVFESPGGYICGEQSALIEAIEEHRAEPRNRPPVIEVNGLFNKPTLLNNVETFAWVPAIMLNGGAWYRDSGVAEGAWYVSRRDPAGNRDQWPRGRGSRFFSICGDVAKPGVFEVPVGTTIGELIAMAGGMRDGLELLAFAPSGPSGGLLPAVLTPNDLPVKRRGRFPAGRSEISLLELPLDKAEFDHLGLMLGAGLLVVARQPGGTAESQVLDIALNATRFFRNESCGKCVPCRVGSQKLVQIGERLMQGPADPATKAELFDLVRALQQTMEQTSICGLGTSASKPLASLYEHDWSKHGTTN